MRVLALVPGETETQLSFFPVINQIKDSFENAEVSVVAAPSATAIYQLSKGVDEVVPYNFEASNSPADWANLLGIVRDREFDVALTLTDSWSIALLLWLSGVPTRLGYSGSANNLLLTSTAPRAAEIDHHGDLLKLINVTGTPPALSVNVPRKDLTVVDNLRQGNGLTNGYVLVYPGTTASGPTYPTESWIAILKDFQQRQPDMPLALLQTDDAAPQTAAIASAVPNLKVLRPETPGQTAALIAAANLLIAVEGYPLPLAIALNVYTLGLFSGNSQVQTITAGADRLVTLTSSTGTLADISPDQVLKKVWSEGA
ncbi:MULTISPECIES: glycosyltransferase family 9 protein [Cyanophyceae]|uniref:Lipopolysaccharide heptosyltransferase family protein n=1 Tax=Leptolyngbya subtilissima DQ-A4 TaxID=2933933 RepID=A0ABV0K3L0_9CYAN|nr:glycosyltransferase family 9 protein [Nodosilinea sp. FACHB-141]MBD2113335.1 glycosyltransferase family 9 protein [Nodosilinea sp. FACHB-141]